MLRIEHFLGVHCGLVLIVWFFVFGLVMSWGQMKLRFELGCWKENCIIDTV